MVDLKVRAVDTNSSPSGRPPVLLTQSRSDPQVPLNDLQCSRHAVIHIRRMMTSPAAHHLSRLLRVSQPNTFYCYSSELKIQIFFFSLVTFTSAAPCSLRKIKNQFLHLKYSSGYLQVIFLPDGRNGRGSQLTTAAELSLFSLAIFTEQPTLFKCSWVPLLFFCYGRQSG